MRSCIQKPPVEYLAHSRSWISKEKTKTKNLFDCIMVGRKYGTRKLVTFREWQHRSRPDI